MNKNCVISEVGKFGKHEDWLSTDYDIWLFNYDYSLPDAYQDYPNVKIIKGSGPRYHLYYNAIKAGIFDFSKYDYILESDNDVIMYPNDINKIFALSKLYNLDISTPSFKHIPNCEPWGCVNMGETGIGYFSCVDQMTNCYSNHAFNIIHDWYIQSQGHGWGFEFMWSKLLDKKNNIAVLYDVIVEHAYDKGNIEQQPDWLYLNFKDKNLNDIAKEMMDFINKHNLQDYHRIIRYGKY